jgi:hypothetical protein
MDRLVVASQLTAGAPECATISSGVEPMALSKEASEFADKLIDSRGGILMAFAQVEWYLAKLIAEASAYDEYKALDLSFSQDAEKRAERLKKILNVDGPFSPYADALNKSLDKVIAHVQLRTMSAHGLVVRPDPEDLSLSSKLHFRMFRMYKGGLHPV